MRYPPMRDANVPSRAACGARPAAATYAWGLTRPEYERRADVWPLNPTVTLLATS